MLQTPNIQKIAVYCASSTKIAPAYFSAAERLAEIFAENNIELIFGAGKMGLMGRMADTMVRLGGRMTGVIPEFMVSLQWHHPQCTELVITKDMAERKTTIWQRADALVALPGGIGTLDEISEVLSLKQLGQLSQPIVFVNTDGYYDGLIQLLHRFMDEKFMSPVFDKMFRVVSTPEEVLPAIADQAGWSIDVAQKHTHI